MHFNMVTSAIFSGVLNNKNNIVFNRVTQINMKHAWCMVLLGQPQRSSLDRILLLPTKQMADVLA
jgi:hypothetical protein